MAAPPGCATIAVMFKLTALDPMLGVVVTRADAFTGGQLGARTASVRHPMWFAERPASEQEPGPSVTAVLEDGPLAGRRIDLDVVEGRPPKTIDVPAEDGSTCRYCLAEWAQGGPSAAYTFLYRVAE